MNNNDKMLQLVLSDQKMNTKYAFNPNDFNTISDALRSDNPVVVAVAKIIEGVSKNPNNTVYKEIYNEIRNHLNKNLI
jgi:hypothetical protein